MRAKIISFIVWILVSLWSRTIKVRYVNKNIRERLAAEGKNAIYAFWHGSIFLLPHTYRNANMLIPASESRDGEIMARLLKNFGFDVVRGSSKRKGHKALLGLIAGIRRGKNVAIAVDGPRGPRHQVKEGVLYLAGKMNVPVVPVVTGAKRFRIMEKTWEKLVLPAPFTSGLIMFGDPVFVQGTSKEELVSRRKELEIRMRRLTREAQELAASPSSAVIRGGPVRQFGWRLGQRLAGVYQTRQNRRRASVQEVIAKQKEQDPPSSPGL